MILNNNNNLPLIQTIFIKKSFTNLTYYFCRDLSLLTSAPGFVLNEPYLPRLQLCYSYYYFANRTTNIIYCRLDYINKYKPLN